MSGKSRQYTETGGSPVWQLPQRWRGRSLTLCPYEEGRKWELFDGELIEVPSTTPEHQMIVSNLMDSLRAYLREHPVGVALPDLEFALRAG